MQARSSPHQKQARLLGRCSRAARRCPQGMQGLWNVSRLARRLETGNRVCVLVVSLYGCSILQGHGHAEGAL